MNRGEKLMGTLSICDSLLVGLVGGRGVEFFSPLVTFLFLFFYLFAIKKKKVNKRGMIGTVVSGISSLLNLLFALDCLNNYSTPAYSLVPTNFILLTSFAFLFYFGKRMGLKRKECVKQPCEQSFWFFNKGFFSSLSKEVGLGKLKDEEKKELLGMINFNLKRLLGYFWYLYFLLIVLGLFGISILSFSPSEDVFSFLTSAFGTGGDKLINFIHSSSGSKLDKLQQIGYFMIFLTATPTVYFYSFIATILVILAIFDFISFKGGFFGNGEIFAPFSFQNNDYWLKRMEANVRKGTKKSFVRKEALSSEKGIKGLDALKGLSVIISIAGTFLAIKFSQGGNIVVMTSIISSQLADKGKERNESTKTELQKMEKKLNQKFLQDFFIVLKQRSFLNVKNVKKIYTNFLKEIVKLNNEGHLFSSILNDIKDKECLLVPVFNNKDENERQEKEKMLTSKLVKELKKDIKKQQFLNDLGINQNEKPNEMVNDLGGKLKKNYEELRKKDETGIELLESLGLELLFKDNEISVRVL